MRKPVVYLHHEDIPQHYEEGTFHYKTMGFGEICHTNDELISVLNKYMENDCEMPEKYRAHAMISSIIPIIITAREFIRK